MPEYILHEDPISGNCYKIRLTAAITSTPLERRMYSVLKGETRTSEFLTNVSSYGKIPVLQVGDSIFLPESNAACYYLADTNASSLIPSDTLQRTEMLRWMFFEQNQHEVSIASLRFWLHFIGKDNLDEFKKTQLDSKRQAGRSVLDCMDEHLGKSENGFFVGQNITLADICLFAYTHVAHEGGFNLDEWPNVKAWCQKVERVPGYIKM